MTQKPPYVVSSYANEFYATVARLWGLVDGDAVEFPATAAIRAGNGSLSPADKGILYMRYFTTERGPVPAAVDRTIRRAMPSDAKALAEIYNHYIATSTATFDTEPKTVSERREWIASHGDTHPVFVVAQGDQILGFGSLSAWAARPAWGRTVEVSTYVAPEARGGGVGAALMEALLEAAVAAGHHALIGQIVAGNEPSLAMSRRFGFEEVGRLREVGYKFGEMLDVVLMQRVISDTIS